MSTPLPSPEALAKLREVARTMHSTNGTAVPIRQLVDLAAQKLDAGVTIDLDASRQLGEPMIVLRMAAGTAGKRLPELSPRENEVAGLIAEGLSNKQIARKLFLSVATIKDHVHRILVKTSLSNRAAIAVNWSMGRKDNEAAK